MALDLRVGVFQARWPIQVHTRNVVEALLDSGCGVDVFLYRAHEDYASVDCRQDADRLRVLRLGELPAEKAVQGDRGALRVSADILLSSVARGLRKLARPIRIPIKKAVESAVFRMRLREREMVLPRAVLKKSLEIASNTKYVALVGVEVVGFVWASEFADQIKSPVLYLNLEVMKGANSSWRSIDWRRAKRLERQYHPKAAGTIIQDADRARVLLADNGVRKTELFYVPVSLIGPPILTKSDYLRRRFNLSAGHHVILSFGRIGAERCIDRLVQVAQRFSENWRLIVHDGGSVSESVKERLSSLNLCGRAIFSWERLPRAEIDALVASADIGLAFYDRIDWNHYLTGRSSEKVARFAQAGVPMVAFNYPSFLEVFSKYGCGVCVDSLEQLPEACARILGDYQAYQQGAWQAYAEVYEFTRHFSTVIDWIRERASRAKAKHR
jgi:glycosyltransferase involved in cell wall biosynthesis